MSETNVAPPVLPVYPTYSAQPYAPDGLAPMAGAISLIAGIVIAGAAMGYVVYIVSKAFYLIFIFPIAIGFALGWIGARMTKSGHVRNPLIGGFAGLLAAIVAMTMVHYFQYREFQSELARFDEETRAVGLLPREEQEQIIRESEKPDAARGLIEALSVQSFPQYIDYTARQGVEIKSSRSGGSSPMNLGHTGTYIYWGLELLVVAGITFAMVRKQARQPFCATCMLWKPMNRLGNLAGDATEVAASINGGDATALARAAYAGRAGSAIDLSMATCDNCNAASADLRAEHLIAQKDKVQRKVLVESSWPAEAIPNLRAMFAPRMTSDDPPPAPATPAPTAST